MSWRCLCGHSAVFTDDKICSYCKKPILSSVNATAISIMRKELGVGLMTEEQTKDRFIEFYAERKPQVAELSDADLQQTIEQLEELCLEAKANLRAAHDERAERRAKASNSQRSWLVSDKIPDQTVSDAISAVKVRKERMSKGDKLIEQLKAAGLDTEFIQSAERKLKTVPDSKLNKATFKKLPDVPSADELDSLIKQAENSVAKEKAGFNPFNKPSTEPAFNPFEKKE